MILADTLSGVETSWKQQKQQKQPKNSNNKKQQQHYDTRWKLITQIGGGLSYENLYHSHTLMNYLTQKPT